MYVGLNLPCASMINFEHLDILCAELDIREKSYDCLNFSRASVVQFWTSQDIMGLNHTSYWKDMAFWVCPEFSCSILSVSLYYWPKLEIRVKSCGRLNLPCASMFNFKRLDILCTWIEHPSENLWSSRKIWPFQFTQSFRVQIWASRYIIVLNWSSNSKVMAFEFALRFQV